MAMLTIGEQGFSDPTSIFTVSQFATTNFKLDVVSHADS